MNSEANPSFDPKVFLAKANGGRTISNYRKNQVVFSQGALADSVFYLRDGQVKVTVISKVQFRTPSIDSPKTRDSAFGWTTQKAR